MHTRRLIVLFLHLFFFSALYASAQSGNGSITGQVKDVQSAALAGARVEVQPQLQPVVSSREGLFTLVNVPPGTYTITISYVGFKPYSSAVTVAAGQTVNVQAVLQVASASEQVLVTAERPHGEAEAINRTLAAENILQVLPSEVITSLPNANIADALGRMPSVTLERDEGEGKYVQIRGTEPRLSNTMVDGVTIPSPETGVRQIKLDTIASDLVDSVEINKTLQANIDADGIGGSVNIVTKTASSEPTIALYGIVGHTPIIGGRTVDQGGGTIGRRFRNDKLGVLIGGTYDYNGRGINDIEPVPTPSSLTPHYMSQDFRDYIYNRTRWGGTGSVDYRLNEASSIAARFLFSTFRNWGNKWVYTLNDGNDPKSTNIPGFGMDWRRPNMAIFSLSLRGSHVFASNTILWTAAVSRSRSLSGSGGANFAWIGDPNIPCANDQSRATSVNRPGWSTGCFGTGQDNAFDKNNYGFIEYDPPTFGQSAQLNLTGSASYSRLYHIGHRFGTFEFGAKIRNGHKFDDTYNEAYLAADQSGASDPVAKHPEWNSTFSDPDYYDGTYGKYPSVVDFGPLKAYALGSGNFTLNGGPGLNDNNYDFVERVTAGYLMNTIELASRVRLVTGVRFEATHLATLSFDGTTNALSFKAGGDYLDVMPSGSLRFALDKDSDLRLVYGRGLARPDPQDVTAAVSQIVKGPPDTLSIGNPSLKAEYANNYDVLYERQLNPLGLIQAGYFYKALSDPIVTKQTITSNSQYDPGRLLILTQPLNAGSAHVQGIEFGFQQRLSYLSSVFGGLGLSANYSYTNSKAYDVDPLRTDSPALLRQAPNTWNISPTYDTRRFSMRVGMTFNDKMIYAYQYENLAYATDSNGNPIVVNGVQPTVPNPQVGGTAGPAGDNYLYAHYQLDAQATYHLPWGFSVYAYGLNMNNEVFGFYQGSPQYVVQREYYHPTYAAGLRWNLVRER
ncbi:TonB-dependent receptor [Paracidobacterium acidisoli]|uniref:TonB-dependent receptor n=1 Tax=Paracidobacterium acidisoli TaxID=2303751 RepID=A0A372IJU3_9BACT|nr:TonB-dependent receptor [Paracidobacterium acidisoli]MBT9333085.1 TonB-dependent receptor [Paracidobacterium acidisoli]